MSEIRISKIKLSEIPQAKRLLSYTWVDTYGKFYSKEAIRKITGVWHSSKNLAQEAKGPDFYFGVAKAGKKIVGLITVRKLNNKIVFMNRLYVHPRYQRQGIGKKLMDKAVLHFKANKIKLEVEGNNKKGVSFYLKNGFRKMGKKREKIEGQVIPVLVMQKTVKRQNSLRRRRTRYF